jgi:hypothetical protein
MTRLPTPSRWARGARPGPWRTGAAAAALVLALTLTGGTAHATNANIRVSTTDLVYCNTIENGWTIEKSNDKGEGASVNAGDTVTWTVKVTKTPADATQQELCLVGYLELTNPGVRPAPIGNIVVNLQRQRRVQLSPGVFGQRWVSASAVVADATAGDAATSAQIQARGSAEVAAWNSQWNTPPTYTVSGLVGTFSENAASGSLALTDLAGNSWPVSPEQTIPAGTLTPIKLIYIAKFDGDQLNIPDGTRTRVEVLVSFGNGGTVVSADLNGNGSIDTALGENRARTTAARLIRPLNPLEDCNEEVSFSDALSTTGSANADIQTSTLPEDGTALSGSGTYTLETLVTGAGQVTNTASLAGTSTSVQLKVGVDASGDPVFKTIECCTATDADASSSVLVSLPPPTETYCTQTQGGWGGPSTGEPGQILDNNFAATYPSGVGIGRTPNFNATWTSATGVRAFLPAGGTAGLLTANLTDPTSTSAGVFAGQTLALTLNLGIANKDRPGTSTIKDLYYCPATSDSLKGQLVSQILAAINQAIGGGSLPSGFAISSLNTLATNLNESYVDCAPASAWAGENLSALPCPPPAP